MPLIKAALVAVTALLFAGLAGLFAVSKGIGGAPQRTGNSKPLFGSDK